MKPSYGLFLASAVYLAPYVDRGVAIAIGIALAAVGFVFYFRGN